MRWMIPAAVAAITAAIVVGIAFWLRDRNR
jgi:hypothetical protein